MPSVTLTARNVAAWRPSDRRDLCDAVVPGLSLRISATGIKSWSVLYRYKGRNRRLTLGRFPEVSLASAREKARQARAEAALGLDPAGEKQETRDRNKDTVAALIAEYERVSASKRSWAEERRTLHVDVLPAWRNRLVSEITRRDVRALVEAKAATAPVMANRLLSRLSRLFNFAMDREWIEANPAHRMPPPAKEQSRDRVLSPDELRELWTALNESARTDATGKRVNRLTPVLNAAFRVMLLTAQRSGEVCRMRWVDVDLESGWWTLPGTATKNGTDHRVPLTSSAVEVIAGQLQTAKPDAVYVFSTQVDRMRVNRSKPATLRRTSIADRAKKAASFLSRGLSFEFRAHDLRRTAASGMAEARIPREHIAHVLNHRSVTHGSITAVYDRYTYDREKQAALECWQRSLLATVGAREHVSKVLHLHRG
ncbi:MAG: tyrosine-type recombinase/integrase [Vicinamibacterales bacterium]